MLNERQCAWLSLLLLAVLPLLPLAARLHPQGQGGVGSGWAFRLPWFSLPMVLAAAVYIVGRPAAVCGAAFATAAVYLLFYYWTDRADVADAAAFAAACGTQTVLLLLPLLLAVLLF